MVSAKLCSLVAIVAIISHERQPWTRAFPMRGAGGLNELAEALGLTQHELWPQLDGAARASTDVALPQTDDMHLRATKRQKAIGSSDLLPHYPSHAMPVTPMLGNGEALVQPQSGFSPAIGQQVHSFNGFPHQGSDSAALPGPDNSLLWDSIDLIPWGFDEHAVLPWHPFSPGYEVALLGGDPVGWGLDQSYSGPAADFESLRHQVNHNQPQAGYSGPITTTDVARPWHLLPGTDASSSRDHESIDSLRSDALTVHEHHSQPEGQQRYSYTSTPAEFPGGPISTYGTLYPENRQHPAHDGRTLNTEQEGFQPPLVGVPNRFMDHGAMYSLQPQPSSNVLTTKGIPFAILELRNPLKREKWDQWLRKDRHPSKSTTQITRRKLIDYSKKPTFGFSKLGEQPPFLIRFRHWNLFSEQTLYGSLELRPREEGESTVPVYAWIEEVSAFGSFFREFWLQLTKEPLDRGRIPAKQHVLGQQFERVSSALEAAMSSSRAPDVRIAFETDDYSVLLLPYEGENLVLGIPKRHGIPPKYIGHFDFDLNSLATYSSPPTPA